MTPLEELQTIEMSLQEFQRRYNVEEANRDYIVVSEAPAKQLVAPYLEATANDPNFREIGTTGQRSSFSAMIREEYNPDLRGPLGLTVFDKMRRSEGQISGLLKLVKTPVLGARWYVDTEDDTARGKKIRDHIDACFFKYMTQSFPQLLFEVLYMLDYGWYIFEKVYDRYDDKVIWRKFSPRHPTDVFQINFDNHGGPDSIKFFSYNVGDQGVYTIPIDKLAIFTYEKEAGDLTGKSVLRPAYKHWYYKDNLYKIDAIQKERHGIGIPLIKLPPGFTPKDRELADEMGRNLRTNEKAHIVVPPMWEITMLKLEGNIVDALKSAEHHDMMIARSVLAQFMNNSATSGSQSDSMELFLKATRYIAEIIRDVFNKYCIPQLVLWNWGERDAYPELKYRRIGETTDWRTISFAIRNFVGAGIIVPDEPLEEYIRDEMDLPKLDEATTRVVTKWQTKDQMEQATQMSLESQKAMVDGAKQAAQNPQGAQPVQQGAQPGRPRQSPAGQMQQQAKGTGNNGRAGRDNSGG